MFDEYGHAIPRQVVLGGQLWFTHTRTETEIIDEEEIENEIKFAVGLKLGAWKPGGEVAAGTGTKVTDWVRDVTEKVSWKACGGNTLLTSSSPADWAPTVSDPELWAVIVNEDAQPTVDRLPAELRDEVLKYWRPAAIADPVARDSRQSRVGRATSTGFLIGTRACGPGQRGSVHLVSGRATREEISGGEQSAGAGAFAHFYERNDVHYRLMSASVPVPVGTHCGSFFDEGWGAPERWLRFVRCDLALGQWRAWERSEYESVVSENGFLLVSVDASEHEWRGGVAVSVNGQRLACAAVHWYDPRDNHIDEQAFCVPVPAQSTVVVQPWSTVGNPRITAAWMPMTDANWRMEPAQPKEHDVVEQADTDGILTGWIDASHGTRGCLAMYAGLEAEDYNDWAQPAVGASAHYYEPSDRWVTCSSAMLPVGRDASFRTTVTHKYGEPKVQLHWTPIVPT